MLLRVNGSLAGRLRKAFPLLVSILGVLYGAGRHQLLATAGGRRQGLITGDLIRQGRKGKGW